MQATVIGGATVHAPVPPEYRRVLTPDALDFVAHLSRRFSPRVEELLARRQEVQARYDAGEKPNWLPETRHVSEGGAAIWLSPWHAPLCSAQCGDAPAAHRTPPPTALPPAAAAVAPPPLPLLTRTPNLACAGARGRVARGAAAGRPAGPAGGDHGAHRPQDGHQRAQQVGASCCSTARYH